MSKMTQQNLILDGIKEIFQDNTVISISGKSGTGKTSLALYLVGSYLTSVIPHNESCVWVQASEPFPKKRLKTMFRDINLKYLINNIFINPGNGPFTSYQQQLEKLARFTNNTFLLPPDLKFIVIDNISHHLRFKISQVSDMEQRSYLINRFYDMVLNPLILRCQRESINLVLIHEVSFDVKAQRTRPFFSKLYNRIRGVNITLLRSFISSQRTIELAYGDRKLIFNFVLANNGFIFSK